MNFSVSNTVHVNREIETTDWEDVLVRKGIAEEREEVKQQRLQKQEIRSRGEILEPSAIEQLKDMNLLGLSEVEDDFDHEVIERIRKKRLEEMQLSAKSNRFGDVYPLARADFVRDVSDASHEYWVVVEMFKDGIQESTLMSSLIREVASHKRACKFMRIRSTDCVDKWPDHSVPCLFLYHNGSMQIQEIGLDFCGGASRATADSLEFALAKHGVFKTELTVDPLVLSAESIAHIKERTMDSATTEEYTRGSKYNNVSALPIGLTSSNLDDLDEDGW